MDVTGRQAAPLQKHLGDQQYSYQQPAISFCSPVGPAFGWELMAESCLLSALMAYLY